MLQICQNFMNYGVDRSAKDAIFQTADLHMTDAIMMMKMFDFAGDGKCRKCFGCQHFLTAASKAMNFPPSISFMQKK